MCDIPDLLNKAIEKNLLKALGNLTTGLVNMPIRAIERRDAEKLAETNARIAITRSAAKQISEQLKVPVEYVKTAGVKHAAKIVQEQLNIDTIVTKTMERLQDGQANEADTESQIGDISDDWLNQFREVACKKSSEDAQDLFSKMLEGEIRKPESFSLRSLTTLADMDQEIAKLFNAFCSLCIIHLEDPMAYLRSPSNFKIKDVIVPIVTGSNTFQGNFRYGSGEFAQKSLFIYQRYGFGLSEFQLLSEYGLIQDDNALNDYSHLWYNNEIYFPVDPSANHPFKAENYQNITISGYRLSSAGKELFHITKRENLPEYLEELIDFLQGYSNVKIHRFSKP